MFSLDAIRNLNKVGLYYCDKSSIVETVLIAYMDSGYDFGIGINAGDAFGGIGSLANRPLLLAGINYLAEKAGSQLTGVLDIPRKMTYTGSNPTNFSITCSLLAVNDIQKDIIAPISRLQEYLLPKSSEEWNTDQLFEKAFNYVGKNKAEYINDMKAQRPETTGGLWDMAQMGLELLKEFTGKVAVMERPVQFSAQSKSLTLKLPGLVVPEVFVKSVGFKVPYVTYVDNSEKPVIDRVDLTLDIETMRYVSRNYMKFLK